MQRFIIALSALALAGCATVVNDSNQPVKIETRDAAGATIKGADCKLTNDYGSASTKSGDTVQIRRSSKDLDVTCVHPGQTDAVARAVSRANAGMAGNIIFGGGIGAIIDHNKGTAYTYPTWMQLVFGKTLVFDRRDEKEGAPVPAMTPEQAAARSGSSSSPAAANTYSPACSQGVPPCNR